MQGQELDPGLFGNSESSGDTSKQGSYHRVWGKGWGNVLRASMHHEVTYMFLYIFHSPEQVLVLIILR